MTKPKSIISKEISDILALVYAYFPELGAIILSWHIDERDDIPTMQTTGETMSYNPAYLAENTTNQNMASVVHEVVHCLFLHPYTLEDNLRAGKDERLWRIALEMVTNTETIAIGEENSLKLPGVPISPFRMPSSMTQQGYFYDPFYNKHTASEIYEELIKLSPAQKAMLGSAQCSGKIILTGDIQENSAAEAKQDGIEKAFAVVDNMLRKGNCPNGILRHVNKLKQSMVPWERILVSHVANVVSGCDEYSWLKSNPRHPLSKEIVVPGLITTEHDGVVVVVDTSGSISESQLETFAAGISKLSSVVDDITVYTCDAKVQEEKVKISAATDVIKKLKFVGGGGTDFTPVFEKIKRCSLMVFFTDGCATFPEKPPNYKVLWLLTRDNIRPPWGKTAYVFDE